MAATLHSAGCRLLPSPPAARTLLCAAQPVRLTALAPLKDIRVLSVSESFRLTALPREALGLARLEGLSREERYALYLDVHSGADTSSY